MSWYRRVKIAFIQKLASVDFFVSDSHKISQPKNLLNLSSDLSNFFYYGSKANNPDSGRLAAPLMSDISPDTSHSDFDGFTGTITVYPNPRRIEPQNMDRERGRSLTNEELVNSGGEYYENSLDDLMPTIDEWIKSKSDEGYVIRKRADTSRMTEGPVLRLDIEKNPSEDYPEIPEVNMSNVNATAIMRLLGLPQEPSGSINAEDLKARIEQVSAEEMQKEVQPSGWVPPVEDAPQQDDDIGDVFTGWQTREPWETPEPIPVQPNQPEGGGGMFMGGRSEGYIDGRLQELYSIADFAVQHGFKEIAWG